MHTQDVRLVWHSDYTTCQVSSSPRVQNILRRRPFRATLPNGERLMVRWYYKDVVIPVGTRFTAESDKDDRCTCSHFHRNYGRALDCLDRLADATCFCAHGAFAGTVCAKCSGVAIPRDTSGLWDKPHIVAHTAKDG